MHRRWTVLSLAALCLMLVFTACGEEDIDDSGTGSGDASPTSEPAPTQGPSVSIADLTTLDWQLVEIDGAPIIDGSIVTLTFIPDNRNLVNGNTDCHGYMAGIDWDDTSFQISETGPFAGLDQHEMTCQHPEGGPEQDTAFFAALNESASYHASNEQLVISDADGNPRLVFGPREAVTIDPVLTNTVWELTSLNGEDLIPGTTVTIAFGPEGANGNDGCNQYGYGILVADVGRLTLTDGFQTEMACLSPEGLMEQADRYYDALASSVAYRVGGDQLELMDHDGTTTLAFTRQMEGAFDANLAAHRWGLIEVNGQPPVPGSLVTLELAEGRVSGSDGCNFYGGELLNASNGSLEVTRGSFVQTAAGCRTDDLLPQAQLLTGMLLDSPWYQIGGDRLTIGDTADNTLVFGPQADVLLIGSSWSVPNLYTELPGGEIRGDSLVEGTEITLTFGDDGTIHGSAGCNTFSGSYAIDGSSITITTPLATTRMFCPDPPGVMEQETTFLDTLGAVTTWEIGMNGLTLKTDDGRSLRELILVVP